MNNYTIDLYEAKPGDIVAFQVGQPRVVSRDEFYLDGLEIIRRYKVAEQSAGTCRPLTLIDPRRLTLDGEPCVRERFTVLASESNTSFYVADSETNKAVAEFYDEANARAYAAWLNRRDQ